MHDNLLMNVRSTSGFASSKLLSSIRQPLMKINNTVLHRTSCDLYAPCLGQQIQPRVTSLKPAPLCLRKLSSQITSREIPYASHSVTWKRKSTKEQSYNSFNQRRFASHGSSVNFVGRVGTRVSPGNVNGNQTLKVRKYRYSYDPLG